MEQFMVNMSSGGITPEYRPKDNIIPDSHQRKMSNADVKSHLIALRSNVIKHPAFKELELEIANIEFQRQLLDKTMTGLTEVYENEDVNQLSVIRQKMKECLAEKQELKKKKQEITKKVDRLIQNIKVFSVNVGDLQSTTHSSDLQLQEKVDESDDEQEALENLEAAHNSKKEVLHRKQEDLHSKQEVLHSKQEALNRAKDEIENVQEALNSLQTPLQGKHNEVKDTVDLKIATETIQAHAEHSESTVLADRFSKSLNTFVESVSLPEGIDVLEHHVKVNAYEMLKDMNTFSEGKIRDIADRLLDFSIQKGYISKDEEGNLHVTAAPDSLLREGQQVRVRYSKDSFQDFTIAKVNYCNEAEWQEIQGKLFAECVNYLIQNPSQIIFHNDKDDKKTEMDEATMQGISNQTDSSPVVQTSLMREEHTFKVDFLVIATMMTALIEQIKHVLKIKEEDHQKYLENLDLMLHKIKLMHIEQEELKSERVKSADQQVEIKEKELLQFLLSKDEWRKELSKITRTYIMIPVESVMKFLTLIEKSPYSEDSKEVQVLIHTAISFALGLLKPVHVNEKAETTHSIDRSNIIK